MPSTDILPIDRVIRTLTRMIYLGAAVLLLGVVLGVLLSGQAAIYAIALGCGGGAWLMGMGYYYRRKWGKKWEKRLGDGVTPG